MHHVIVLDRAEEYRTKHYGITHTGRNVYKTTQSHSPTRLVVWDNTNRANRYLGRKPGETVGEGQTAQVLTDWFLRTYPNALTAKWFDPHNKPTDEPVTLLLSTESSVLSGGTSTGSVASGQVYWPGVRLADEDTATLSYPDGTTREIVLHFPPHQNGHGYATFA